VRLANIDPAEVAEEVVRLVADHLASTAIRLDPTLSMPALHGEGLGGMGLRATVRALATYAQRGLPVWDWTDHGMAADGLLDVIAALYSRPADGGLSRTAIDVLDDVDPVDAIGLVLVAAAARVQLDRKHALSARELGALAGIGSAAIRKLTRAGELPAEGAGVRGEPLRVPADAAVRWLAARGVSGF